MKLLIDVVGNKPLSAYGDNHIIAYNSKSKNYYVTTAESFFAAQNLKIQQMKKSFDDTNERIQRLQKDISQFEINMQQQVESFTGTMDDRFNDFLRTYQETNRKLIEMVKELIKDKEE